MNRYLLAILAGIVLCAPAGWSGAVELPLTDDAFINGTKPDLNTGTWASVVVHNYGPKYGLVRFDAASIAGQEVSEATLTVYLNSLARNGTISLHAITSGWNEATVTWNNQPPAEAAATATVELTTGDVGGVIEIDVTGAVQRWADGSLADAGFLMVTSEDIRAKFDAKEMAGGVPATLTVETGEPAYTGEAIVLDFTDPDDCVIDEPGYYILDRSWDFDSVDSPAACSQLVINTNSKVMLNLRGYSITGNDPDGVVSLPGSVLQGANVTIQDGEIAGDIYTFHGSLVFKNTGLRGTLEAQDTNLFILSSRMHGALVYKTISTAACSATVIRNSEFSDCLGFPMNACLFVHACESTIVRDNQFAGTAQLQGPGGGVFIGNVLQLNDVGLADGQAAIEIGIASNIVVARNILDMPDGSGIGILVRGLASQGNIVDGNIIQRGRIGIDFSNTTGNYYGNNRVSATRPYVHTEAQVDWGGNVVF